MRTPHRVLAATALAALVAALPPTATAQTTAQAAASPAATGVAADLLMDIAQLESKMMALAKAIPTDKYDWRPSPGARSVIEVLRHVAADNYFLPAVVGHAADASTGIKGEDFNTAVAFERRPLDRVQTLAQLERSFAHLKQGLGATTPARLGEQVSMFGRSFTVQQTWILTATHLHEHLGQLIAYARSNNVTPPWSQQ